MSHEISMARGTASFFSAVEPAWHRLGKIVDSALTSEEAIKAAELDYSVFKAPAIAGVVYNEYAEGDEKYCPIPLGEEGRKFIKENRDDRSLPVVESSFNTVRADTGHILGTVGKDYHIIQNTEIFNFFDSIVESKEAIFETAGSLRNGEVIFVTAKLPSNIRIASAPYEEIANYLLLTSSFTGKSSAIAKFTPTRVVCNNTLSAALAEKNNRIAIRHTANAPARMAQAKQLLNLVQVQSEEMAEVYDRMVRTRISDKRILTLIDQIVMTDVEYKRIYENYEEHNEVLSTRKQNVLKTLRDYYHLGPGQELESCKGTVYGFYNTITGYLNNAKQYKDEERKFQTIFTPNASTDMERAAFKLALNQI